ncbi:hypothetical protein K3495_g2067 [Podosphaera aphanis]|nr:hypothetical protein K3495_g2067 [Podosphaera aphanis]
MTGVALVGGTGLVGSHMLKILLNHPYFTCIDSISRRAPLTIEETSPTDADTKLRPHFSSEISEWPAQLALLTPTPAIFFSALGTTKAKAGSIAAQRLIDYDLNLALATSAQKAGVKVYVLISVAGAGSQSFLPLAKMKGDLEESVKDLGFKTVVILRPGLLLGDRSESRPAEWAARKVAGITGVLGNKVTDFWAQDAIVVARAAVSAGKQALESDKGDVWQLAQSDIVRLGRTEWTT